jgi:hypothetical protein
MLVRLVSFAADGAPRRRRPRRPIFGAFDCHAGRDRDAPREPQPGGAGEPRQRDF